MPYGYLDTRLIDFPPNIDEAYIRGLQTPRGISFAAALARIDARLQAASQVADPLVAALISFTTEASIDGTTPTAYSLEEENEYGLGRPEFSAPRGHMLAFRKYRKSMGFTEEGLMEMTDAQLDKQIDSFVATFIRGARVNVLTRLFSDAEVYVDTKTTATSPGFAGSGTGDNVFQGTYPDGTALPANYTLYARDTSANLATVLKSQRDKLKKWAPGPYDLIASQTEIDALVALGAPDFVAAESSLILRAQGTAAANVNADQFVGVFDKDVRVWHGLNELGTSPNIAIFKSYGAFDARNPLVWRYDPTFGRGINIKYRSLFPLDQAEMRQRYGISVANRTGAVLTSIAGTGNYTPPTIA